MQSMALHVFRSWCLDERALVYSGPTTDAVMAVCPNDPLHALDPDSVTLVSGEVATDAVGNIVPGGGGSGSVPWVPSGDLVARSAEIAGLLTAGAAAVAGALSGTTAAFSEYLTAASADVAGLLRSGGVTVRGLTSTARLYAEDSLAVTMHPTVAGPYKSKSGRMLCSSWLWRRGDRQPTAFHVRGLRDGKKPKPTAFVVFDADRNAVLGGIRVDAPPTGEAETYTCTISDTLRVPGSDAMFSLEVYIETNGSAFECDSMAFTFSR